MPDNLKILIFPVLFAITLNILLSTPKRAWKRLFKWFFVLSGIGAGLGFIALGIEALDGWHFVGICLICGSIGWLIQSLISDGVEQGIRNSRS